MFSDESGAFRKSGRPTSSCDGQWALVISVADQTLFPDVSSFTSKRGLCRDNPQRQPILINPEDAYSKLSKCRIGYYEAGSNFELKDETFVNQGS